MKYLLDTCGWIEFVAKGILASKFEGYARDIKNQIIPTIVQHEVYKWLCREVSETEATKMIAYMGGGCVVNLDTSLALYAADVSREYKLAMADAIIYATALNYDVELITCDKHFKGLNQVVYFKK